MECILYTVSCFGVYYHLSEHSYKNCHHDMAMFDWIYTSLDISITLSWPVNYKTPTSRLADCILILINFVHAVPGLTASPLNVQDSSDTTCNTNKDVYNIWINTTLIRTAPECFTSELA